MVEVTCGERSFGGAAEVGATTGAFLCLAEWGLVWMELGPPITRGCQAFEAGNRPRFRIPSESAVGSDVDPPATSLELSRFRHLLSQTNTRREVDKACRGTYRDGRRESWKPHNSSSGFNERPPVTVNLTDARRRWLAELYQLDSAAVFNQCRRLLGSREDAADATQEVFLRAAASLTEAPDSPQARAWLTKVARNHCIDLLRRRERFTSALTTLAATAGPTAGSVQTVEDRQLLQAVLRQMGVREREALWRSAVADLPVGDIARSFGVSYLAAAQLLHRARRQALVLATRLAVILGLARIGQAARRLNLALRSEQIAAVVVVPLAIAAMVVSSAPQRPIRVEAKSPPGSVSAQSLASSPLKGLQPGKGGLPVLATADVVKVTAAQMEAVSAVPTATIVKPGPLSAAPSDLDKDHGKGRDRDDSTHKHPRHENAGGHDLLS